MAAIVINDSLMISEDEISEDFVRSSGPGGQNVNKVATAVQLSFDVEGSSLPAAVKQRLFKIAANRIDGRGCLRIDAHRHRTQEGNRRAARERLVGWIDDAAHPPKPRRGTRPTRASKRRRIEAKVRKSKKKQLRGRVPHSDDS